MTESGPPATANDRRTDSDPLFAVPDALHGVVVTPDGLRWDGRRTVAPSPGTVEQIGDGAIRALPGVVRVVQQRNFVAVVAVRPDQALQAARTLTSTLRWHLPARGAEAKDGAQASSDGDERVYRWRAPVSPPQQRAVVVWADAGQAAVWIDPRSADACRDELAHLLDLPRTAITLHPLPDATHANAPIEPAAIDLPTIDAAAAAALMSRATGQPVRVAVDAPPDREVLSVVAPPLPPTPTLRSATALPRPSLLRAALRSPQPWAVRPSLARLLSRPDDAPPSHALTLALVDPAVARLPATVAVAAPLSNASPLALLAAQVFAQESLLDESLRAAGLDPIAHRLAQPTDPRGQALLEQVVARAQCREAMPPPSSESSPMLGRGLALAQVERTASDGRSARRSWTAWVADVSIDPGTGHIDVTRLTVGHDSGTLTPARSGVILHDDPGLLSSTRALLGAPARFDDWGVATSTSLATSPLSPSAEAAPISVPAATSTTATAAAQHDTATFAIGDGRLDFDGVLSLPAAAAIANAVHDATGVRLREAPFDAHALSTALADQRGAPATAPSDRDPPDRRAATPGTPRWGKWAAAAAASIGGALAMAWPLKPAIAPIAGADLSVYSTAAIERGRLVAIAGDCAVCHTAPGGITNVGGLAMDTPFGTIYTTNITPDIRTGIGDWSFSAFDRAMRQGVHRDGRQLYPAFPYTAFAKLSEADMQALYGYLMAQPAVESTPPTTRLAFPYNQRPLMAGWNLLFHDDQAYRPDPNRSAEWNRGAYLVQGAGHCGACHTPRNALGAERSSPAARLAGGSVEGWEAPALNALATAPVPWHPDDLFTYLRTGFSRHHGVAAGPMAPVVQGLAQLPASDVAAIVTYLIGTPGEAAATPTPTPTPTRTPAASVASPGAARPSETTAPSLTDTLFAGERIYQNACSVCHEPGQGPTLFGVKPSLALNTSLHSDSPDNLIQVILHGIQEPANGDLGYMPGFKDSLDDHQLGQLITYLRARFAPAQPAWTTIADRLSRLRAAPPAAHSAAPAASATPPALR